MTSTTILLPFQPATMSKAQLAAVSFLARYAGQPTICMRFSCASGSPGARPTGSTRCSGSNVPTSSCTSATSPSGA
ncbi:hypothetical protein [Terrabacter aerolatus]|uniref:hypothetical protein n=1 Tax=Terrabacter aerolatus TaxID=422442 RepID=UPI0016499557